MIKRKCKTCTTIVKNRYECRKCRHKRLKMSSPMEYAYKMNKSNAKKRKPKHFPSGIPFTVSLEDYKKVWLKSPKKWKEKKLSLQSKNKKRACKWEVDRIDPFKGYEKGNLRIVSKRLNILLWINRNGEKEFIIQSMIESESDDNYYSDNGVPF